MKNANPSDLLPEWSTVRGRLEKLELNKKSVKKILKMNKSTKKKKLNFRSPNVKSPSKSGKSRLFSEEDSELNKRSMSVTHNEDLFKKFEQLNDNLEKLNQKEQKIQTLETEIEKLKSNQKLEDCICHLIKDVKKVECSNCNWLINKQNFETHISFCSKVSTQREELESDELVNIHQEPEARIKESMSSEALNDIWNVYSNKKSSLQDYSELKSPQLSPFPTSVEGWKQFDRTPIAIQNIQNKENSRNTRERYKTTDSFIQRLSHSQSILNFPKDESITEETGRSSRQKYSINMRTSDTQAMTYQSHLDQETSHILNRVKKLKEDLDTMRSPFKDRNSIQFN